MLTGRWIEKDSLGILSFEKKWIRMPTFPRARREAFHRIHTVEMLGVSGAPAGEHAWGSREEDPCCPELVDRGCSMLVSRSSGPGWGGARARCGETTSVEQRLCDDLDRSLGFPQDLDHKS